MLCEPFHYVEGYLKYMYRSNVFCEVERASCYERAVENTSDEMQ